MLLSRARRRLLLLLLLLRWKESLLLLLLLVLWGQVLGRHGALVGHHSLVLLLKKQKNETKVRK